MQRYLVIINYDGPNDELVAEIGALALAEASRFHVVVPAVSSGGAEIDGEGRARAQRQLDVILNAIRPVAEVDGEVGDANIYHAAQDALDRADYDVFIVASPVSRNDGARRRLVRDFTVLYGLPVVHVNTRGHWLRHHQLHVGLEMDQGGSSRRGPVAAVTARGRWRASRRIVAFLATVSVILGGTTVAAVAWGASRRPSAATGFPTVSVTEANFTIHLSVSRTSAGPVAFAVKNGGPSAHELVVFRTALAANKLPLGTDGNVIEDSPSLVKIADSGTDIPAGGSRTLYAVLTPGNYVFVCNLPGHYRLGMRAALTVTPAA